VDRQNEINIDSTGC